MDGAEEYGAARIRAGLVTRCDFFDQGLQFLDLVGLSIGEVLGFADVGVEVVEFGNRFPIHLGVFWRFEIGLEIFPFSVANAIDGFGRGLTQVSVRVDIKEGVPSGIGFAEEEIGLVDAVDGAVVRDIESG